MAGTAAEVTEDPLAARLAATVGEAHVLTDPDLRAQYEIDWTRRFGGPSRLVVLPGTTDEVAAVLRACAEAGAAVVPQGGNTGLVGGGVPRDGEVVLSLRRLDEVGTVDELGAQIVVGAGATLAAVQQTARAAGLDVGVDLASRDSATVGGMVATNAGGTHVLRYGGMRGQVLGVEAVLADGSVVSRLGGLGKDNTGYDLPGLLAGSEGTLAVITRVCVRLVPLLPARAVALLGVPDTAAALRVFAALRPLPSLSAAELMYADGLALVRAHADLGPPLEDEWPAYLLVECAAGTDPTEELGAAVIACPDVGDGAVATDASGRERLWAYRERHTEAISAAGVPHKLDVTLPLSRLAGFVDEVRGRLVELDPGATCVLFGHVGDGNLHVNVLGPAPDDDRVDDAVLRLVAHYGGSISSEHGIGVAKLRWLALTRSPEDIAAMRAVKQAFDPDGLLNPGAVLPPPG
jgi:FAD/FMN-containing dehydrogenase